MEGPHRVAIVSPIFEDWASYAQLAAGLDAMVAGMDGYVIDLIAVDDGSPSGMKPELLCERNYPNLNKIEVVELVCNLGHQRAIAVGLYHAVERKCYQSIVIMDADGEDRPQDVKRMLQEKARLQVDALVALRASRSEGLGFRVFYQMYRALFRLLTGHSIGFGNFSVLSQNAAFRLLHMPALWNNFPSALLRSRLPYAGLPTDRGERYQGMSKMNLTNLVIHGLSAISVDSEVIFSRVLLFSGAVGFLTVLTTGVVLGVRLFTDLAIPGWASNVVGNLAVIFLQTVFFFLLSLFFLLHSRSTPERFTAQVAPDYIVGVREIDTGSGIGV